MSQPNTRTNALAANGRRKPAGAVPAGLRRPFAAWACLLCALAGCQAPPAQPETGATGHGDRSRGKALTEQLVADTAVQTATAPLATSSQAVCDVAAVVVRAGQELVCKRLVLPLTGSPCPLGADRSRPAGAGSPDASHLEAILKHISKHD